MSTELLTQLYVGYYNRAPDPDGLEYWENRYEEGMSAAEIAQSFSVQDESKANYPYLVDQASNDTGAFINKIYKNLFDRAPDPEGLAYWTAQLDAGRPVGSFILDVINGARNTEDGQDKTMLANKVQVGIAFKDAEAGKDNPNVIEDAKDVMSGVNHSDASIVMALGKISDAASGATTVFSGSSLDHIDDGTLNVDGNVYADAADGADPQTVLVTNSADFEMTGTINLGGASSQLTVRGEGSSAKFNAVFDHNARSTFGRFSGDQSTVNVADGAEVTFGKDIKLGRLLTDDENGTAGGNSIAALNILEGGKVYVGETAKFAVDSEDDGGDTTATSKIDVLVQGAGSLLDIDDRLQAGGSGGDVTIDVRSGGKLDAENQIRLGFVTDYDPNDGGKGVLEVRGENSIVQTSEIRAAIGKGSEAEIFADDGATINASQVQIAGNGGTGSLKLTDGATLTSSELEIARFSGSTADVEVSRGASVTSENNINIGRFNNGDVYDDGYVDMSVPNGATTVDLLISEGGSLKSDESFSVATRYDIADETTPGEESSTVNITVTGEGSLLESKKDWSDFGISKNAKATLNILDGGKAILGEGANFGKNSDRHDQYGGEGNLVIDGAGSSVSFINDSDKSIDFGRGQGTVGNLTVSNGGTLDAKQIEAGREGGTSTIDVSGDTTVQLTEITAARFSGSTATINIADGATVELENRLDMANFVFGDIYDDGNSDFGVANATTTAELNVTNGGVLKLGNHIDAATRWEDKDGVDVGTESAIVNINVAGAGSKIESSNNTSFFGVSKDAVANVTVSDGGEIVFGNGATFGEAAEDFSLKGGEGNLTVTGDGSKVSFVGNSGDVYNQLDFARGENTKSKFTVSDGGHVTAGQIQAGDNGGVADIDIDGGAILIAYTGEDAYSGSFVLGNDAAIGPTTLDITNGGSLTIDGNGKLVPFFRTARNDGSEANVTVSGEGSSLTILNDNPRLEPDGEFGNAFMQIGRGGTSAFSILDGATVTNTQSGIVTIGQDETSNASVIVDGAGTNFNFGAMLYIGDIDENSGASMSVTNGATVTRLGDYVDNSGDTVNGIQLEGGGATLTIDAASTVNSNVAVIGGNFIVSAAIETVDINGALSHTGGEIDLQIASATSFDKLITTGGSKLEGELNIAFQEGFSGAAGDSFELFNASEFEIGGGFTLDVTGMGAGLDAQLQVSGGVASLVLFDSQVADFAII